jgi:hypothetical protein
MERSAIRDQTSFARDPGFRCAPSELRSLTTTSRRNCRFIALTREPRSIFLTDAIGEIQT